MWYLMHSMTVQVFLAKKVFFLELCLWFFPEWCTPPFPPTQVTLLSPLVAGSTQQKGKAGEKYRPAPVSLLWQF